MGRADIHQPLVSPKVYGADRELVGGVMRALSDDLRMEAEWRAKRARREPLLRFLAACAIGVCTSVLLWLVVPSSQYAFIETAADGSPLAWDSCKPIHYVVNTDGAPAAAEQQVAKAVRSISAASGVQFVYDGSTNEPGRAARPAKDPDRYGAGWSPVLIAWASPKEPGSGLAKLDHALARRSVSTNAEGSRQIVSGVVLVNKDHERYRTSPSPQFTLRHEMGHILGLAHVRSSGEVMHWEPTANNRARHWGRGDKAGLRELGPRAQNC